MKKLTTEEFIKRAREVHGNKYDYSKVEYVNAHTKVCIICSKHGEFYQKPNNHLNGQGCSKCFYPNIKLTTENFIQKAREIHGDKYDYSRVEYKDTKTKVCIICNKHGEFQQNFEKHIVRKCGCPKCAGKGKTVEEFVETANLIHYNKYDYSKVRYESATTKVCIICPEHGEFYQKPSKHLSGDGCPVCDESHLEKETRSVLKEKKIKFTQECKFKWLGLQSLDFYLPDYNIAIECQGIQHFQPVDYAGLGKQWAEKQLLLNQSRDKKKKELCEENGVKLCYINYDDDIEEKLLEIL